MPVISGPVGISLLEKDNVRYLLVGDKHTSFMAGACDIDSLLMPQYLTELFNNNEQWDMYIEQGVTPILKEDFEEGKGAFLTEAKKELTVDEIAKYADKYRDNMKDPPDMLELTYNFFRANGCFFTNRTMCNYSYKNVRFHFIDARQARLGESCVMPSFEELRGIGIEGKTLYMGLFDTIKKRRWIGRPQLKQLLDEYCDQYFEQVESLLKCFGEVKIKKQFQNSVMKDELDRYFEAPLRMFSIILQSVLVKLKPQQDEIVNSVLTLVGHFINHPDSHTELQNAIVGVMPGQVGPRVFGESYWNTMTEMIENSEYLKIATATNKRTLPHDPTDLVFEGNKMIMDMYALGRMTKPYNKNVVVLAGYNHYNNYYHFFRKNGFKLVWVGEKLGDKCFRVPEIKAPRKKFLGLFGGAKTRKRNGNGNGTRKSLPLCCEATKKDKVCRRGSDGSVFSLPRKFTRRTCLTKKKMGYSQRASCAPYLKCNRREKERRRKTLRKHRKGPKRFLYYPDNPDKSFDVYIDKNPADTISIKYSTVDDVKSTIRKLERLYKRGKYSHKRIWQVGMIMKVRLDAIKKHHPDVPSINARTKLARKYFNFLGERTKKDEAQRKKMKFE